MSTTQTLNARLNDAQAQDHPIRELRKGFVVYFVFALVAKLVVGLPFKLCLGVPMLLLLAEVAEVYLSREEILTVSWSRAMLKAAGAAGIGFTLAVLIGQAFHLYPAIGYAAWGKERGAIGMFWASHQISRNVTAPFLLFALIAWASIGCVRGKRFAQCVTLGLGLIAVAGVLIPRHTGMLPTILNEWDQSDWHTPSLSLASFNPSGKAQTPITNPLPFNDVPCTDWRAKEDTDAIKHETGGTVVWEVRSLVHQDCRPNFTDLPASWNGKVYRFDSIGGKACQYWLQYAAPHDKPIGPLSPDELAMLDTKVIVNEYTNPLAVRIEGTEGCEIRIYVPSEITNSTQLTEKDRELSNPAPASEQQPTTEEPLLSYPPDTVPVGRYDNGNFHVYIKGCSNEGAQIRCSGAVEVSKFAGEEPVQVEFNRFRITDQNGSAYNVGAGLWGRTNAFAIGFAWGMINPGMTAKPFSFLIEKAAGHATKINIESITNQGDGHMSIANISVH